MEHTDDDGCKSEGYMMSFAFKAELPGSDFGMLYDTLNIFFNKTVTRDCDSGSQPPSCSAAVITTDGTRTADNSTFTFNTVGDATLDIDAEYAAVTPDTCNMNTDIVLFLGDGVEMIYDTSNMPFISDYGDSYISVSWNQDA
jgi:hypothetical protein